MSHLPLTQVKRRGVEVALAGLKNQSAGASTEAAKNLIGEAREFGLGLRDFLNLAIDVPASEAADRFRDGQGFLTGYEATLAYLGLPIKDNFERGVVLDMAADTFQTYTGTRALFPEVVDDIVKYKYRQEQFETPTAIVGSSRTVAGVEMITTIVDDQASDYQVVQAVSELGRVPVKSIRSTQNSVGFFKHGGGYRVSYEFNRRARIDMLAPFVARMNREMERSKTWAATGILINGDGVNPAAEVVAQSTLDSSASAGKISYKGLLQWLVNRAKAGAPVDTVIGDWAAYIAWLQMFAIPTSNSTRTDADNLAASGFRIGGVPILNGFVNFALSSAVPSGQLVGFSKSDTLEELIEAGSVIEESERSIQNQSITYVKTENAGYKLSFPDTRSIYDFAN